MKIPVLVAVILLLFSQALAQPREVHEVIVHREVGGEGVAIPVDIRVDGVIDIRNTTLTYEHRFSNPYNETLRFALRYWSTGQPRVLEVSVDGEKAELETVSEDEYRSEYRLPLSIGENDTITVTSRMRYPTLPERYRLGLWGSYYSLSPSINVEFLAPGLRQYPYGSIRGEIELPVNVKKVRCNNCKYHEDKNTVTIDLKDRRYPSFSLNFQTRRTPVKAGMFYLLMLAVIFGFVIRGRTKGLEGER
jgi:hypothetical protein